MSAFDMILGSINAGLCAINVYLYAVDRRPGSLAVAVFCGLVAVGIWLGGAAL